MKTEVRNRPKTTKQLSRRSDKMIRELKAMVKELEQEFAVIDEIKRHVREAEKRIQSQGTAR